MIVFKNEKRKERKKYIKEILYRSDKDALKSDWNSIGDDIRKVLGISKKCR